MQYLLIVLDGAGDTGKQTPLFLARKPWMDKLAETGVLGTLDIGYKKDVNSDVGYLTLLGCFDENTYPGRGYLEALAVFDEIRENDICIRGNFATLDKNGNVLDRRAGRDETGLERFCELLDGLEIDGVKFFIRKSSGHRVVILMRGERLSDMVSPNDPMKTGVPLFQVKPKSPEAKFTASVLNKFVYRVSQTLSKQPENKKRKYPANTILIRNIGKRKTVKSFKERFGLSACCIAGINIAKGVAKFLGIDIIPVKGATGMPDTNLEGKFKAVEKALKKYDFVWLHINGTDICSHNRQPEKKKEFIEKIDMCLGKLLEKLNLEETVIIITCDHRTASSPSFKGYEHLKDPVPFLVSGNRIEPDEKKHFNEKECENGVKLQGNELLEWVFEVIKNERS